MRVFRCPIAYLGVYLAVYTGLRRSELCGLRWGDVDWEKSVLHVRRMRQFVRGREILDVPKTKRSIRDIALAEPQTEVLRSFHRRAQVWSHGRGERWNVESYVLSRPDGKPIYPDTLTHDLRKTLRALNFPPISFHDLRHTHATLLLESGVPLVTVSTRLGHSSIRLTADVYAHVTDTMQRDAIEKLTNALDKLDS
jgi:integrase